MKKKNNLMVIESMETGNKTFYVPISKLQVTLYKVRAKTQIHANQKFNYLHHNKGSKINAHRKITINETYSNLAYEDNEVPNYVDLISREVDHYDYHDESFDVPNDHIALVH
tara:strand:+ start:597 stop:932 length:336 start_codon:yes stop_codon:yes gene_type:complete